MKVNIDKVWRPLTIVLEDKDEFESLFALLWSDIVCQGDSDKNRAKLYEELRLAKIAMEE